MLPNNTIFAIFDKVNYLEYNIVMKKVALLLALILLSANFANAASGDFLKKLMNQPSSQERLAPVKSAYDDEMSLSEQAVILYNENNLTAAFDTLLKIKEADRTALDWVLLGNILQDQVKVSDAVFMYQRAIIVDPKCYKAYYNLGNIYLEEDKPNLAIENYRKANKINNQFAYAYYNLGCAYLKLGETNKAKIAFLKAVELKNTEACFHYNLAYTYKLLKNTKLSKQYLDNYNKLMEAENQ